MCVLGTLPQPRHQHLGRGPEKLQQNGKTVRLGLMANPQKPPKGHLATSTVITHRHQGSKLWHKMHIGTGNAVISQQSKEPFVGTLP
eukprot:351159-Chlamydomonas_euryale.AAC.9